MRKIVFIILTLLILIPLKGTGEDKGFHFDVSRDVIEIPIELRNNLAVMPLYINEKGPFYFILDTGVNTTILTEPALAGLLDLNITETIMVYGLGGEGIVEAAVATGVDMDIRGITGNNMDLIVIPEDILSFSETFGFPVFGILGHDFFKNFGVEISYADERLTLYRNSNYRIRGGDDVIPIDIVQGKPYVSSTLIGQDGDQVKTQLLIDLGASNPLYLNNTYVPLSETTMDGYLGRGISGNLLGQLGRIESLVVGESKIDNPVVSYPDENFLQFEGEEIDWEGIIGGGIIKRFDLILDYAEEIMILRPNKHISEPFHTNLSGLEVISGGDDFSDFIIHYVRRGSTGYEAGIMPGDEIIELNRRDGDSLDLEYILDELSGSPGDRINLTYSRNGETKEVTFRLREDLPFS